MYLLQVGCRPGAGQSPRCVLSHSWSLLLAVWLILTDESHSKWIKVTPFSLIMMNDQANLYTNVYIKINYKIFIPYNLYSHVAKSSVISEQCKWRNDPCTVVVFAIWAKYNLQKSQKKNSGLQQDLSPWPPWYQCDTLPTDLRSHTMGGRSILWVHFSISQLHCMQFIVLCHSL